MSQSPRISSDRELIPTAEACRISGLGRQYIERLLRQGRLEGIKPGRDWFVYEDSLQTFLAQPRKRGPKGPHKKPSPDIPTGKVDTTNLENGLDES